MSTDGNQKAIDSQGSTTKVEVEASTELTLGHWIYIHRYPINEAAETPKGEKKAVLVSISKTDFDTIMGEKDELKKVVDTLQEDIADLAQNEDPKEKTKSAKEHALTVLKTMGIISTGDQKDENGVNLAEFISLEDKQLCFCRQSTLSEIVTAAENTRRFKEITIPSDFLKPEQLKELFVAAISSITIDGKVSVDVETKGNLADHLYAPLGEWFGKMEDSLSGELKGTNIFCAYEANIETVFLRYFAGASGSADFQLSATKLDASLTGEAKVQVDLVRSTAKAAMYVPSKEGLELRIPPVPPEYQQSPELALAEGYTMRPPRLIPDKPFPFSNEFPKINFEFDSSFITSDVLAKFASIEKTLKENPRFKIQIVGHTDQVGTGNYNQSLSERRARSVLAYIQNNVDYWEQLYSELEPGKWGVRSLKHMLHKILTDRRPKMNAGQRLKFDKIKNKLKFKLDHPDAHLHGWTMIQTLSLYFDIKHLADKSADAISKETRKMIFGDYMCTPSDVFVTRGRFHPQKLVFLGENAPMQNTGDRNRANRRVECWFYEAYNDKDFANFGNVRIHLDGDLQGYVGANACAAVDLDAHVDAGQFIPRGIERADHSETNEVKELTVDLTDTSESKTTDKTQTTIIEDPNQHGLAETHVTGTTQTTTQGFAIDDGDNSFSVERNQTQTTKTTTTEKLYYDTDTNAITKTKKQDFRTSDDIEWKLDSDTKVKGSLPDGVLDGGASANLKVFAGAKAEATGFIAAEWTSKEQPDTENEGFLVLAQCGAGVEGSAGAGAEVDFAVRYEDNKILVRAKLAAAIGLGAGIQVDMQVSPVNLYSMYIFFAKQLIKGDYTFLKYISEEAWQIVEYAFFKYFEKGVYVVLDLIEDGQLAIEQAKLIGEAAYDGVIKKLDEFGNDISEKMLIMDTEIKYWWSNTQKTLEENKVTRQNAISLAESVKRNPHGLRYASPDIKARMITDLILSHEGLPYIDLTADEHVEEAILCVFMWIQSQREFTKIMQKVGRAAPVRPIQSQDIFKVKGEYNHELYKTAMAQFKSDRGVYGERQKTRLLGILDGIENIRYQVWLSSELPEKPILNKDGNIVPNKYLYSFYGSDGMPKMPKGL